MSIILKSIIDKYNIELETDIDEDVTTQCFVEHKCYHASLAVLESEGVLYKGDMSMAVPYSTISMIKEWASSKGY